MKYPILGKILLVFSIAGYLDCGSTQKSAKSEGLTDFIVNSNEANIEFFWKDNDGNIFRNIENLRKYTETNGRKLRFAMNGGMYQENNKPLGLFIQNQKTITPLNTREEANGNFYLKPNGVFYITTAKKAFITLTQNFKSDEQIKFATQSGPMLVIEGEINPVFKQNSDNLNIRNGVCVLDDSKIVFVISERQVNFYDFAAHFKNLGCRDALYLDGFVSRIYLPEKDIKQLDGDFGVIIGVTE
jgi:uncharacterized protein YigE (DUF2233 family)